MSKRIIRVQKSFLLFFVVSLFLLIVPLTGYAQTVIFDQGPLTGTNSGYWHNETNSQNFAEQFSFYQALTITSINIFTHAVPTSGTVHIKILSDSGGNPGSYLYQEDQVPMSWVADPNGGYRVTCVLTQPFQANANTTYWIGVSGNGFELGQDSVLTPGDGTMAQFSGPSFTHHATVGDMMFQLLGDQEGVSVPTMTEWGMIIFIVLAGIGSVYYLRRLKRG